MVALVWPDITAYALTIWVAAWALVTGIVEVGLAFGRGQPAGPPPARPRPARSAPTSGPDIGALTLATVCGLFSIFYGTSALVLAGQARRVGNTAGRLTHAAA